MYDFFFTRATQHCTLLLMEIMKRLALIGLHESGNFSATLRWISTAVQ